MDVDARVLESVVGRAFETTPVRLVQWSTEEIFAGDGQGLGVFRVTGSAQADDRLRDWSIIVRCCPTRAQHLWMGGALRCVSPSPTTRACWMRFRRPLALHAASATPSKAAATTCG